MGFEKLKIYLAETKDEFELAAQLFEEYVGCLEFDLDFQNFQDEIANLSNRYVRPKGCLLIAEHDNKVAGCVGLGDLGHGICEMKRLYVKQKFRGLKIGKSLAKAVIEYSRKAGYNFMRLDFIRPREAELLYKSLGFKEIVAYEDIPIAGAVFMELKLER